MSFGEIFKKARKNAQKTLKEVADHVEMHIGNISDIEHGRRRPPKEEVLLKFEKFYGLPKNYLTKAAKKEWKVPDEVITIYMQRPQLTMALLRDTGDFSEGELNKLIETFRRQGRK